MTKRKKSKLSLEERRERNREKVLQLSSLFPTVGLDTLISALMTAKGKMDEATMVVAKIVAAEVSHEEHSFDACVVDDGSIQILQEGDYEYEQPEEQEEEKVEEECKEQPLEQIQQLEQDPVYFVALEQLRDFFPELSTALLHDALVVCRGDADDACQYLVSTLMEVEEEEEPHGFSMMQVNDNYFSSNGDLSETQTEETEEYESDGDVLDEEEEVEYDLEDAVGGDEEEEEYMELEVLETANFTWFQDALDDQAAYMEELQKHDQEVAKMLQEQEYLTIDFEKLMGSNSVTKRKQKLERPISRPSAFNPLKFWGDYEARIRKRLPGLIKLEYIVKDEFLNRFKDYMTNAEDPTVLLTYHGTREHNIQPISEQGLVVPGAGNTVQIANGSALGVGIYMSLNPTLSMHYCHGGNKMIVCAVAIGKKCITTRSGDVIVSFNERQVLPCWVATFEKPTVITGTPHRPRVRMSRPSTIPDKPQKQKQKKKPKKLHKMKNK